MEVVCDAGWSQAVMETLHHFQQQQLLCNISILTDGGPLEAHANVLAASSPVLQERLTEQNMILEIDSITAAVWTHLLTYMYTGKVLVPEHETVAVLHAAQLLQLTHLAETIENASTAATAGKRSHTTNLDLPQVKTEEAKETIVYLKDLAESEELTLESDRECVKKEFNLLKESRVEGTGSTVEVMDSTEEETERTGKEVESTAEELEFVRSLRSNRKRAVKMNTAEDEDCNPYKKMYLTSSSRRKARNQEDKDPRKKKRKCVGEKNRRVVSSVNVKSEDDASENEINHDDLNEQSDLEVDMLEEIDNDELVNLKEELAAFKELRTESAESNEDLRTLQNIGLVRHTTEKEKEEYFKQRMKYYKKRLHKSRVKIFGDDSTESSRIMDFNAEEINLITDYLDTDSYECRSDGQIKYSCPLCPDKDFSTSEEFVNHAEVCGKAELLRFPNQKLIMYRCCDCDSKYRWKKSFTEHLQTQRAQGKCSTNETADEKVLLCLDCGKVFLKELLFHEHKNRGCKFRHRFKVAEYRCRNCFRFFTDLRMALLHSKAKKPCVQYMKPPEDGDSDEEEIEEKDNEDEDMNEEIYEERKYEHEGKEEENYEDRYEDDYDSDMDDTKPTENDEETLQLLQDIGMVRSTTQKEKEEHYKKRAEYYESKLPKGVQKKRHRFKPAEFRCKNCGRYFTDVTKALRHSQRKQKCDGPLSQEIKCDVCHRKYQNMRSLQRHKNNKYACVPVEGEEDEKYKWIETKHMCQLCDFGARITQQLTSHVRQVHPEAYEEALGPLARGAVVCQVCKMVLEKPHNITEHLWFEHAVKSLKKTAYYHCPVSTCSFRSTLTAKYHNHIQMHAEHKTYEYVCAICGQQFTRASSLKKHESLHVDVKPYHCAHCTLSFRRAEHLTEHMPTHTRVAPYSCKLCSKRFLRKKVANKHINEEHGVVQANVKKIREYTRFDVNYIPTMTKEQLAQRIAELELEKAEQNQNSESQQPKPKQSPRICKIVKNSNATIDMTSSIENTPIVLQQEPSPGYKIIALEQEPAANGSIIQLSTTIEGEDIAYSLNKIEYVTSDGVPIEEDAIYAEVADADELEEYLSQHGDAVTVVLNP